MSNWKWRFWWQRRANKDYPTLPDFDGPLTYKPTTRRAVKLKLIYRGKRNPIIVSDRIPAPPDPAAMDEGE